MSNNFLKQLEKRKDVKHHQERCFPQMRDEVAQDLARLEGGA